MNKVLENRRSMYEGVRNLFMQNQSKIAEVPAFTESVNSFTSLLGELDQMAQDFGKVAAARAKWITFNEAMGIRESSTSERKGVRISIEQVFAEIDELLADEIDRHMEHLKQKYSPFWEQYFSARMVKDVGIRHRIEVTKPATAPAPEMAMAK